MQDILGWEILAFDSSAVGKLPGGPATSRLGAVTVTHTKGRERGRCASRGDPFASPLGFLGGREDSK